MGVPLTLTPREGAEFRAMAYTVGEVAEIAGVSVRTLHHYDEEGLLKPSARAPAGYRQYTEADVERLQLVLFYRTLGFKLDEIKRQLDDPEYDRRAALVSQRALLAERAERARALVDLVDRTILALDGDTVMDAKALFDGFDPAEYEEEAKARWGRTAAYIESQRRATKYGPDDWKKMKAEAEATTAALAALAASGARPDDVRAMALAEAHRLHIDRWFYPCSSEVHVGLGEMYVADERFTATYDEVRPGLARFLRDAIVANAARAGGRGL